MIRVYAGLALLAVSWLLGLHYFDPARPASWVVAVLSGVVCLGGLIERLPSRREMLSALVLVLLPIWYLPWPWRVGPLLLGAGLLVEVAPAPARWLRWVARGALAAGGVLLIQAVTLMGYTAHSARSHELPTWLAWGVVGTARLLGLDAALDRGDLVFRTLGEPVRLAATRELLVDPATLGFFVAGLAVLGLAAAQHLVRGSRWLGWLHAARAFCVVMLLWLPIRLGLAMGLYVNRAMLTEPGASPTAMDQFFSPWFHLLLLAGPVLLCRRFVPWPGSAGRLPARGEKRSDVARSGATGCLSARAKSAATQAASPALPRRYRAAASLALFAAGTGLIAAAAVWAPVGRPKAGRVMVVERHSRWEPTTRPYDTTWYGEPASYNYAAVYDVCAQYFEMSRLLESDAFDEETLAGCDVLVVKTPTARYSAAEVRAIVRFVEQGGGLLLIGDHTNVFRSSTYLNDLARQFGFTFRNDLLFRLGSPYEQQYRRPLVPHPAVQYLPPTDLAVSCSIDPGTSRGRAAMRSTGLWSLPSAYHAENYHPHAEYRPEMRYGAFIQTWATTQGRGRVMAFTDSTIFSNFCVFQPGKTELLLGMLQWLNHTAFFDRPWADVLMVVVLGLAGLVLAGLGATLAAARPGAWLPLAAAGLFGLSIAGMTVAARQRAGMPPLEASRPVSRVVIDRTSSEAPLAKGAYNESETGFGLLEQAIARLGGMTMRRSGEAAFGGDAIVAICPTRSVPHAFREGLRRYVEQGGRLLVIDSPDSEGSTANSLLWPFGMRVSHSEIAQGGELTIAGRRAGFPVEAASTISGGEPFATLGGRTVGARNKCGEGEVLAIGFGYLMNDTHLGGTWLREPGADALAKYELLYAVLRGLLSGGPVEPPEDWREPAAPKPDAPQAPDVPEAPLVLPDELPGS